MIFNRKKRLKKGTKALNINKNVFYIYYYHYLKKIITKSYSDNSLNIII